MNVRSKLERFSLAGIASLVYCLRVREPTQMKYRYSVPLYGRLLALPTDLAEKLLQGQTL